MIAKSLSQTVRRAYAWTTAGNLTKNIAGFGISLVLAKLLGPNDFGLLGMAMVFTNILGMVQDCGIGQAVVYYQEDRRELPLYFTAAGLLGVAIALAAFFGAPVLAVFYRQPAVIPVVRVLSPTLFLGSLCSVAQGCLTRELDFRRIALVELAGTLIGGVTGIACAWLGYGVWALVVNVVLSLTIQATALCWMVRPSFTLNLDFDKLKKLLRWGLPLTGASLLWQTYENADYMVVGRVLGQEALGYYGFAFRVATLINSRFANIITRVSFPAFSALQNSFEDLVSHWYAVTETLMLVVCPLSAMLAIDAHDFLLLVGAKWLPAEVALQLLCILGALKCLVSTTSNCMHAIGRTDLSFRYSLTNAILLPLAFIAGCKLGGYNGVAAAWCVVSPLTLAWFLLKTLRLVNGSPREYAARLRPGLLVAAACAATMYLAGVPFSPGVLRFIVRSLAGAVVTLACYWSHPATRAMIESCLPARLRRSSGGEEAAPQLEQ